MLYAIFFYSKGPVLQIPVPKGSSVTGKFYRESVLTQLVDFCQKCRPRTSVRGIKLLHDNAPAHKSATVQEYLKESGPDVFNMDGKISEQRVYCKIRAQLRFPPTEIYADLQKVYGNGALKYATVCKWVRRFNDGRESVENDRRVGSPVSLLTEKNVATVIKLIEEDVRYTVQEMEELSGIHLSSVLKILRERLGLHKICVRWVPHLLTDEQKQNRVRLASQVIKKYDKCDPHRLEEIVTGDETWIYHFQPDSKAKNKVWVSSEGDRPVIVRHCKTSNRTLYAIFFERSSPSDSSPER